MKPEMVEKQSDGRSCDLSLVLSRYGGCHTWYDAKVGLKRQVVLIGRIDDPFIRPLGDIDEFGEGNSVFHNKPVRLVITSPPDLQWLGKIADELGVGEVFGAVLVKAHVEPERFEDDGEMVEAAPVTVTMTVSGEAFEAIRSQVREASDDHRILWATVTMVGKSLPEPASRLGGMLLKELDVSKNTGHAIGGFNIFDTRYFDDLRERVRQVECDLDKGYGADISVLLTEARYELGADDALVHAISCEGRVINGKGKPYDGVDVTVEFAEHKTNRHDELPETAFFGEFGYYPKLPKEQHSFTHFALFLRYLPEDARSFLIALLSQEVGTQVILTVNLTNEEAELLAATDEIRGNVRHYSFEVRRRLVTDRRD